MEIWDCKSGVQVASAVVKNTEYSYPPDIRLQFSSDSSFLLTWSRNYLLCTEIESGLTSVFNLKDIVATTFLSSPSSTEVITIDCEATIYLHSCNGLLRRATGQLSSVPDGNSKMWICPKGEKFAVNVRGTLILREIMGDKQEIRWQGSCIGAIFPTDGTCLSVIEEYQGPQQQILRVSNLKLPEMSLNRCWSVILYNHDSMVVVPREYANSFEVRNKSSSSVIAFCSPEGRAHLPQVLFHRKDRKIQYSNRHLLELPWHSTYSCLNFAGEYVAWKDGNQRAFVVDMSLLVKYK
jgi:hypothetical protein